MKIWSNDELTYIESSTLKNATATLQIRKRIREKTNDMINAIMQVARHDLIRNEDLITLFDVLILVCEKRKLNELAETLKNAKETFVLSLVSKKLIKGK